MKKIIIKQDNFHNLTVSKAWYSHRTNFKIILINPNITLKNKKNILFNAPNTVLDKKKEFLWKIEKGCA